MGILSALAWPVLGSPTLVAWLAQKLAEEAERELLDEDRIRAELLELQTRYDLGEVSEQEFTEREGIVVARLNAIREAKAERQ